MERLTKYVNGAVWYNYKGNKYPAYDMDNSDMLHALNRLAQLEDEAEQRDQGCIYCCGKYCDKCGNNGLCDDCENKSLYVPIEKYCPECGRKLVE